MVKKPEKSEKTEKLEKKIQVNYETKPFGQLMSDVVFTISGYQNPFRGELRQKAHDMGARYRGDWDNSCTHLICAFVNTPKFNQVKGRGKIVKKDWIEKSYSDRKRYPWRRYCLDNQDKGDESEEEIHEQTAQASTSKPTNKSTTEKNEDLDQDTDEEIEKIKEIEKNKQKESLEKNKQTKKQEEKPKNMINSMYGEEEEDTDDEIEKIREKQETEIKQEKVKQETEVRVKQETETAYDLDTDDEIEDIKQNGKLKEEKNNVAEEAAYDQETDEEIDEKQSFKINDSTSEEDPYEADTDIDEDVIKPETEIKVKKVKQETEVKVNKPAKNGISKDKSTKTLPNFPPLPSYFDGKIFFVFGSFSTDEVRKSINRGIIAGGGKIKQYMGPEVNYIITSGGYDKKNFQEAKTVNSQIVFLRPSYIKDCIDENKFVSPQKQYLIMEKGHGWNSFKQISTSKKIQLSRYE